MVLPTFAGCSMVAKNLQSKIPGFGGVLLFYFEIFFTLICNYFYFFQFIFIFKSKLKTS